MIQAPELWRTERGTASPALSFSECQSIAPETSSAMGEVLVSSASSVGGKSVQEDATWHGDLPGYRVVVVADGISSTRRADIAARTAILELAAHLEWETLAGRRITERTLICGFARAQHALKKQWQLRGYGGDGPGTTLIVAVESAEQFLAGYVGDGAIVLTTGRLDWMQNMLYAQIGRAGALTHYVGIDQVPVRPAILRCPKVWDDGGILLIGSDGGLPQGQVLATANTILHEIRAHTMDSRQTVIDPTRILQRWVESDLNTDDNRSLGLLVSREAFAFWKAVPTNSPCTEREVDNGAGSRPANWRGARTPGRRENR